MLDRFGRLCFGTLLFGTLWFSSGLSAAAEKGLPDEVRAALRENAQQLDPVTVHYTLATTTNLNQEEALARLRLDGRAAASIFYKSKRRVAWHGGKIYTYRTRYSKGRESDTSEDESSFDGKILYTGSHRGAQPVMFKQWMSDAMKKQPAGQHLREDYLLAAGIQLPKMTEWDRPSAKPALLYQLEKGGKLESVVNEGAPGSLLRVTLLAPSLMRDEAKQVDLKKEAELLKGSKETPARQKELLDALRKQQEASQRRFIYHLDPAKHYAVVRWEERELKPDRVVSECVNSGFEQLSGRSVWLPKHCEFQLHEFPQLPGTYFADAPLSNVIEVSEIDTALISDDRFALAFKEPGTFVQDATLPEAKKRPSGYVAYTIPASSADLEEVIQRARNGEKFSPGLPPRPSSRLTAGFIAANVLLFVAVAGYLAYRFGWRSRKAA